MIKPREAEGSAMDKGGDMGGPAANNSSDFVSGGLGGFPTPPTNKY